MDTKFYALLFIARPTGCLDSSLDGDFTTWTRPDDAPDPRPIVEGKHLLLPGRSDFEDELVREVAHFELAEFVIGEMEALNAMTQANCVPVDNTGSTNQVSNITRSVVFAHRHKTQTKESSGGQKSTHSSLGFLAFVDPQNLRVTSSARNLQHLVKDDSHSPFAGPFGRIQQGMFVDAVESGRNLGQSNSFCRTETNSTRLLTPSSFAYEPDEAEPYADEVDLAQSRMVTTLASNLLTSCLERVATQPPDSPARQFLKELHQLLVVSCDADWAFRCPTGPGRPSTSELSPARALIPSNSVVICPFLSDSGGQRIDFLSLDPQRHCTTFQGDLSRRRRCHSFSSIDQKTSASVSVYPTRGDSPVRRSYVSVHRTACPDRHTEVKRVDSKSNCHMEQPDLCTSSSSVRPESIDPVDGYSSINAICTPLAYDLLINAPVPKSKRKVILFNQKNCCAGCGLFVETPYLKRMRFCEFFGRFFCCVCHTNTLMILPGNIVTAWDFRALPVSNIARDRLNQLHRQPLLRITDFNPRVLQNQAALRNCSTLRKQGNMILPFVQLCQSAQSLLISLQALPAHWLSSPDLWSIADLCAVRDGLLDRELRRALQPIVDHLSTCTRCRAQGYVCEICHAGQILFPFGQVNTVSCPVCMACFHRSCLRSPKPDNCPRCLRRSQRQIQRRKQQQQQQCPSISEKRMMMQT
ncbi:Run domain Beclin-1 interacting and cystein-rich containing protein [Fasciola gigantica]|uniref:Run domain Beclin-1 interacting and cystein-rich containing protein n=1 Tax=Fasciola gigantica TaxID=46835 RepID=A0A504Z9K0_FASGI|nr:Run domain Beclin-1 interacting and cystein-rich containing protein [Fasciola gigantica]